MLALARVALCCPLLENRVGFDKARQPSRKTTSLVRKNSEERTQPALVELFVFASVMPMGSPSGPCVCFCSDVAVVTVVLLGAPLGLEGLPRKCQPPLVNTTFDNGKLNGHVCHRIYRHDSSAITASPDRLLPGWPDV